MHGHRGGLVFLLAETRTLWLTGEPSTRLTGEPRRDTGRKRDKTTTASAQTPRPGKPPRSSHPPPDVVAFASLPRREDAPIGRDGPERPQDARRRDFGAFKVESPRRAGATTSPARSRPVRCPSAPLRGPEQGEGLREGDRAQPPPEAGPEDQPCLRARPGGGDHDPGRGLARGALRALAEGLSPAGPPRPRPHGGRHRRRHGGDGGVTGGVGGVTGGVTGRGASRGARGRRG